MHPNTHLGINRRLCGEVLTLAPGHATVRLETTAEMAADAQGLVHGGFVFGAADYAAMLAVNDPNVVLGSAELRFTAPVRVGEAVEAEAALEGVERRKHRVRVVARVGARTVLEGQLTAFVLAQHVLNDAP